MTTSQELLEQHTTALQQRAEELLHKRKKSANVISSGDVDQLLHELMVHQIELELQNEELRQAQVQLGEARDLYSMLYDFAPVGYMTIDNNGLIEQANLMSTTMLGIERGNLIARPLRRFVHLEDQGLLYQHRSEIIAGPDLLHTVELRLTHVENRSFPVQLESRAIDTTDGQRGYRTIISDITARKQQEAALLASHEQLATTLAQLQSAQAALVQQERLAAVGRLTTGIAHDFNNSLTVISGYIELLLRNELPDSVAHKRLKLIQKQSTRAAEIVQQLLDFSRKSTVPFQTIELAPLLRESVELLQTTIPCSFQLRLHLPQTSYFVHGNITQLQQVVINLLDNARAAMPNGGLIEIRLHSVTTAPKGVELFTSISAGPWVEVEIIDQGEGIPAEVLPQIFEPFFTTKGPQGTGLGLAQVYGIMKQHNGEVTVTSKVGVGTTFALYLPTVFTPPVTLPAPAPIATESLTREEHQPTNVALHLHGSGKKILIVDDDLMIREMLSEFLKWIGYNPISVADGISALALYQQQHQEIALVITDLTMPQMDGVELTKALRLLTPTAKIIIMSGYQPDTAIPQLNRDEVLWLQKPILLDQLQRAVAQILQAT